MAVKDRMEKPLQESLLALLAYDDKNGGVVAKLLNPSYFDGDYVDIATRCIDYHLKYKMAPKVHIDDLFGDMLVKRDDNRHLTYRYALTGLLKIVDEGINVKYLFDTVKEFVRLQRTRQVLLDAVQRVSSKQEYALDEVDDILYEMLRARHETTSIGMRLRDIDRMFDAMRKQGSEFKLGIKQLDDKNICPARGTVMLVLGPSGVGKSWLMTHIGKASLTCRYKVLHVTLEMSEEQVAQRYLQSLFSIATRDVRTTVTRIEEIKRNDKKYPDHEFKLNVDMPAQFKLYNKSDDNFSLAREELQNRFEWVGGKLDNLIIKQWTSGNLTPRELSAHIDMLETIERFVPDIVVVDYLGIMKGSADPDKKRHVLGQNLVELRSIAAERNVAMVVAHQVSREGARAELTENVHVAEDWSLIGTSDIILTLSVTKAEKELGLCRLFVSKARSEKDKFGVVLTQNYALGQFVIDSIPMHPRYTSILSDLLRKDDGNGDDEES